MPREPPAPAAVQNYATVWVVRLPRPHPFRESGCMPVGTPWWRRLGRQVIPRHGGRACCSYHGGDGHRASKAAVRLVRQAQRADVDPDDIVTYVHDLAQAEGITGWELRALDSLLRSPLQMDEENEWYGNGTGSYLVPK